MHLKRAPNGGTTIPGFNIGGTGGQEANTREASRRHRFLVHVMEPLTRQLLFYAHKVTIPAMEVDRIVMHHGQDEIYFPGKNRWSSLEIAFYRAHDTNGDMAAREIRKWMGQSLIDLKQSKINAAGGGGGGGDGGGGGGGGQQVLSSPGMAGGNVDKRTCVIQVLDGAGSPVYVYTIHGAWPQKSTPDPMDFTDSSVADITVIFQVDKVEEEAVGAAQVETKMCDDSGGSQSLLQGPGTSGSPGSTSGSGGTGQLLTQ